MAGLAASRLTLHPTVRAIILVTSLVALVGISWRTTGKLLPTEPNDVLLVQSSLLLVVLATLISERYFTGPGDAFLNGLTALLTVLPLWATAPTLAWWMLVSYLLLVIGVALIALALQRGNEDRVTSSVTIRRVQRAAFHISSVLGRARVVYSIVFLTAVIFFLKDPGRLATTLLVFWGIYLALWPLGIPQLLSRLIRQEAEDTTSVGALIRVDSPDIARVLLRSEVKWTGTEEPVVVSLADGSSRWGIPLMSENRTDGVLGTVLLGADAPNSPRAAGSVHRADCTTTPLGRSDFVAEVSGGQGTKILGLVRENSRSTRLRFELLPATSLVIGQLVIVATASGWVYYQVIDGETTEEPFGTLNYGSQIATALPVGVLRSDGVFGKADWIPTLNAPVFEVDSSLTAGEESDGQFVLGNVPGTQLQLRGNFVQEFQSHTAILGATGSGKTEFAFDLLRHTAAAGHKVICIDLTAQYARRLKDLSPIHLTISDEQALKLGEKLFEAETGKYGGGDEKKVLHSFATSLRLEVEDRLKNFLDDKNHSTALIELREISNTKATLWITEMYLSTLLKLAKEEITSGKILVVIEEAHTVMPESSFSGLGDFDSKGTIAKISQLALQGRKYGVGLLILAQRTATVSKSVLTQCNTVISFACIDDTSINFLRNVYGNSIAEGLPALKKLRAVAHGQWIASDMPVVFDVSFDATKANRADWGSQTISE